MKLFLVTFSLLCLSQTKAQHVLLRGKVTDEYGNPVSYASIICKKTKAGTWANSNGEYSIVVDKNLDDTIICSHISYLTKKENIGSSKTINFVLQRERPELYLVKMPVTAIKKLDTNSNEIPVQGYMTRVEVSAQFPGGVSGFINEFKIKFALLDSSKLSSFEGEIKIQFTVAKDGTLKDVNLIKGIDAFCDAFIIQTVMKMRHWNPAVQNGRNVEDLKEISILFDKANL